MSIKRINYFKSQNGKADQLFEFLNSILPIITNSKGCLSCEILKDTEEENKIVILEEWESIEDHKNSIKNIPPENMMKAMTMLAEPPSGNYYSK